MPRSLAVFVTLASAFVVLLAAPVAAAPAPVDPPGWHDPGSNAWVAFTLSDLSPSPSGRTGYNPVLLQRDTSGGLDVHGAFDNWDSRPSPSDPTVTEYGWPSVWELHPGGGTIRLERTDAWCPEADSSCHYKIVSGNGESFFVFGGTPPTDPGTGQPTPDPTGYFHGQISLPPLPQIHLGTLGAVGTADPNGGPGTIHLDAPGTHDDQPGTLTYDWVLQSQSGKIYAGQGETFDATVNEDGTYCVQLTVTASDGAHESTPACGPGGGGATFVITGVAPKAPGPGPTPGGGGGGGPSGGGGGFPGVVFSPPAARAPAAISGGGGASPTIVWLWRPEWYQTTPKQTHAPRTSGQPEVKGRQVIVVQRDPPQGASAGPWLAGVGAFGLIGGAWVISRRRRMRMLAEL